MGVKNLMSWISKEHPGVVKLYPSRWASPAVRGKRVAIDATLQVNRFHFANKDLDGRGETALLGWYRMVCAMREQGVEPVAIWDERGRRMWKAPEAMRRLNQRSLTLARRDHEDRRRERLMRLQDEVAVYQALSELEQRIVTGVQRSGIEAIPATHGSSSSLSWPLVDTTVVLVLFVARLAAHVGALYDLAMEHKQDSQETSTAIAEEEEDPESDEQESWPFHIEAESAPGGAEMRVDALPARAYTETRRQRELSNMEAEVWQRLGLHPVELWSDDASDPESLPPPEDADLQEPPASAMAQIEQLAEEDSIADHPSDDTAVGIDEISDAAHTLLQDLPGAVAMLNETISLSSPVLDTYLRALDMPLEEHHADCRALLTAMGVPVVMAPIPFEAEGLASAMVLAGVADYVGTEDSDAIAYGGTMLRNLSTPSKPLIVVDAGALRSKLTLSPDAFRDFCILLGTDASPRIPGVGPVRALALIEQYKSIERILAEREELAKLCGPGFMDMINNARRLFTDLPKVEEWTAAAEDGEDKAEKGRVWLAEKGISVYGRKGVVTGQRVVVKVPGGDANEQSKKKTKAGNLDAWIEGMEAKAPVPVAKVVPKTQPKEHCTQATPRIKARRRPQNVWPE